MFRKTPSVLLALVITLSCMMAMIVPAVADTYTPEGTVIDSWDDITDVSGKYYLTTDITVTTSSAINFKGVLDGKDQNGTVHTITTSVPLFTQLDAGVTIKNLKTTGTITVTLAANTMVGTLATKANGAVNLINCTNDANINYTANGQCYVGGFIGSALGKANVVTNCTNNGNLTSSSGGTGTCHAGGLFGRTANGNSTYIPESFYTNCTNTGNINNTYSNTTSHTGGLIGHYNCNEKFTFTNCTNSGIITTAVPGSDAQAIGGIVGRVEANYTHKYIGCSNSGALSGPAAYMGGIVAHDPSTDVIIRDCSNTAALTVTMGATKWANVGGIIGANAKAALTANSSDTTTVYIENCSNSGDISINTSNGTNLVGGIAGNLYNTVARVIRNCNNSGDISTVTDSKGSKAGGIVGYAATASNSAMVFYGCVNKGDIAAYTAVGGVVAQAMQTAKIVACVNTGTITAKGSVTANPYAGGIAGTVNKATVYQCINYGTVVNKDGTDTSKTYNNNTAGKASAMVANGTVTYSYCEDAGILDSEAQIIAFTGTNCLDKATREDTTVEVEFEGVQRSIAVADETTFSVRFICSITNIESYMNAGVMVYYTEQNSAAVKYTQKDTTTVYSQITGLEDGVNYAYPEQVIDGTYFSSLTVTKLSVDKNYTFIVVPYTIAIDGSIAFGEACAVEVNCGVITSDGVYNLAGFSN